jgi:hypothetical protein
MFQCLFGKPEIYHLSCCSLSNDEVCEVDNEWAGPVGANNPQSDNVMLLLYWDLNSQLSFACNRAALHEYAGVLFKVSQA